jgi:hypothetical protein
MNGAVGVGRPRPRAPTLQCRAEPLQQSPTHRWNSKESLLSFFCTLERFRQRNVTWRIAPNPAINGHLSAVCRDPDLLRDRCRHLGPERCSARSFLSCSVDRQVSSVLGAEPPAGAAQAGSPKLSGCLDTDEQLVGARGVTLELDDVDEIVAGQFCRDQPGRRPVAALLMPSTMTGPAFSTARVR